MEPGLVEPSPTGAVEIILAGGPRLLRDGELVADGLARRRSALLAAHLLLRPGEGVPADELADAVWPEDVPTSWAATLRRLATDVRQWLGQAGISHALTTSHGRYRLELPDHASVDVLSAAAELRRVPPDLEGALRAAHGLREPLLPGFDAPWLSHHRGLLAEIRLQAIETAADLCRRANRWDEAVLLAEEAIAIDPLRESAHRLVMAAHRDAGRVGAALRAYERCRARLRDDLGAAPSPATALAYQALLTGGTALRSGDASRSADPRTSDAATAALAVAAIGSRTAVANLEARLAAIEADPHPDPLRRLDLLVDLGRARWALDGATDHLRRISLAAGEAALALHADGHLGAALALASTTTGVGLADADTDELCGRVLARSTGDDPLTARALALRSELRGGPEAVALASQAVEVARRCHDPGLLLDVLLALDQALSYGPDLGTRLAVEEECNRLAGVVDRWRVRPTFEPLTRLQLGQIGWLRDEAERMADLARTSSQWEPAFYSRAFPAMLAHVSGDLERAAAAADALLALSGDEQNAAHAAAAMYLAIERDRGGVVLLLPAVEELARDNPRIVAFRSAAVLAQVIADRHADARRGLDAMLDDGGDALERDHTFAPSMALLAEAVGALGSRSHAETILRLLDPYTGQVCAGVHAAIVLGAVDSFRGIAARVAGDLDGAVQAHRSGLALEESIDAPLFQARSCAWLALALGGRRAAGDLDEARDLGARARGLAERHGAAGAAAAVAHALAQVDLEAAV